MYVCIPDGDLFQNFKAAPTIGNPFGPGNFAAK